MYSTCLNSKNPSYFLNYLKKGKVFLASARRPLTGYEHIRAGQDPFWYSQTIWNFYLGTWETFSLTLWILVRSASARGADGLLSRALLRLRRALLCHSTSAFSTAPSFFHYRDFPQHTEPERRINVCTPAAQQRVAVTRKHARYLTMDRAIRGCFSSQLISAASVSIV